MIGAMELQPDDGPRTSLSIGPGFGRCSGISLEFARRFTEGIRKLAGNISGDYRNKTIGLTTRMSDWREPVDDAVGNSLGVRRELTEGIGSLLRWRKGVRQKKIKTRRKIVGGSRKSYRDLGVRPRIRREGGRRAIARTSPKVSGRSLGTRREIAGGRP
ncbi:hypothetical protein GW17_00041996 [Ensete ventricosum]|nr:hypothetical protein GW17_00041996 [Ensete ventricosum]